MEAIFISYRRTDSASAVGRLTEALAERVGADQIFRDLDTMTAGTDFVHSGMRKLSS